MAAVRIPLRPEVLLPEHRKPEVYLHRPTWLRNLSQFSRFREPFLFNKSPFSLTHYSYSPAAANGLPSASLSLPFFLSLSLPHSLPHSLSLISLFHWLSRSHLTLSCHCQVNVARKNCLLLQYPAAPSISSNHPRQGWSWEREACESVCEIEMT